MERITRSMLEKAFEMLVKTMNGRIATSYKDGGAYRLDHNNVYGGYEIQQICNEHGAVSTPFGQRVAAREAFEAYHFARQVLESMEVK